MATVSAIPPQSGETGETVQVDVSPLFSDPDGDALTYSAATSDAAVADASVAGSVVTVSLVGAGTATITVTATDPGGLSASLEAAVTVTQANRAPVATVSAIPPQSGETGETVQVDVSPLFSDPDGDALTYSAATSDAAVADASVAGSVVTVSLVGAGTATITVTATDPGGLSASLEAAVTVTQANRAPVATVSAIPPQSGETGETVQVDVSPLFSDPDGDALTYSAATSDAAVADASVAGSVVTVSLVGAGTATITVTATDPGGLSASLEAAVTVEDPPPPGFSVDLRIEPSQSQSDAFRVLADPTFFADEFDLDVYIITGDDAATWEFTNDQPITADEGRVELADFNFGATPQPLEDVTKAKVVFQESSDATHVLLCTLMSGISAQRVEATCSPAPPPPPPTTPFDGSVELRIEPSQSQNDAFRVLADPTFFVGEFDLDVYLITGDDAATWEFTNDQPVTADEGRAELADFNFGATPQPLEDVTKAKVVFEESSDATHVLLCTLMPETSSQRVEATCSPAPLPPPPPIPFDGSVDLRIEPSQSQSDAFRVLADPTFFADEFDLDVYIITGDDTATWEFTNDQPITADEGRVELADFNFGATPQPLEDVTKVRVVYDVNFSTTYSLLCAISDERSSQRIEASCSTP